MRISNEMLKALEKTVELELQDETLKKYDLEDLLKALLEEVRRIHKTNDRFSEPLARSIVDSLPWHLQSFQLYSKIRDGKPL